MTASSRTKPNSPSASATSSKSSVLPVHPAAELFPLMEGAEFDELVTDIKANGLREPIALWGGGERSGGQVLDGRNRYRACLAAGIRPRFEHLPAVDPLKYVISANIRRRHLSVEDKDRLIVQLLKLDPTRSNRQVAKLTDTSHPHVAKVRERAQKTGDVETVTTSVDTKGRKQPSSKPRSPPSQPRRLPIRETVPQPRDDIGPASAGEADRLRVRCEELSRENRRLERENLALKSEIAELQEALAKRPPPPAEGGLDIPKFLPRAAPASTTEQVAE